MSTSRSEQIIAARALKEAKKASRIALGSGLPAELRPLLEGGREIVLLKDGSEPSGEKFDLILVEAVEVSRRGDLVAVREGEVRDREGRRWIALTSLERDNVADAPLVNKCRRPVQRAACVDLVITEFGVLQVTEVGFELVELAPGASSDDVRVRINASLHVVDDIELMEL